MMTALSAMALLTVMTPSPGRAQAFREVCTSAGVPRLEAKGSELLVNGKPRFAVFVSYFDVMRASPATLEQDFALLSSKGVDGIRVFPLWIRFAGLPSSQKPEATLLDSDGRIRSQERWDHFALALKTAAQCGLLVDITFNRENLDTVSQLTVAEYRGDPQATRCAGGAGGAGLSEVACRLRGPEYAHVLLDLQNERNIGPPAMSLTLEELKSIRDAVKAIAPERLVMVSHGGGEVAGVVEAAHAATLDVVALHQAQERGWHEATAAQLAQLKQLGRPVYVQESGRATMPDERFRGAACALVQGEENPFVTAMEEAKRAGAAAWTFHTDAGFRLDSQPFQKELKGCPRESEFLNLLQKTR